MLRIRTALFGCLLLVGCSSKSADSAVGASETGDAGGKSDSGGAVCTTRGAECLAKQDICSSDGKTESCVECPDGKYAKDQNTCADIPGTLQQHVFEPY